jgi:hypothetical protein
VAGWPRECVWIGPNVNDISCVNCTFGFVANVSDPARTCVLPPFGVRSGAWDRTAYEAAASFGSADPVSGRPTLYLRNAVTVDAPAVAANPKQSFVGFSSSNYMGIRCVCAASPHQKRIARLFWHLLNLEGSTLRASSPPAMGSGQ